MIPGAPLGPLTGEIRDADGRWIAQLFEVPAAGPSHIDGIDILSSPPRTAVLPNPGALDRVQAEALVEHILSQLTDERVEALLFHLLRHGKGRTSDWAETVLKKAGWWR